MYPLEPQQYFRACVATEGQEDIDTWIVIVITEKAGSKKCMIVPILIKITHCVFI